jgi:hypothetical protein
MPFVRLAESTGAFVGLGAAITSAREMTHQRSFLSHGGLWAAL